MIITYEEDARCNVEVGSIEKGWHACGRPAVAFCDRQHGSGGEFRVFFCKRHQERASSRNRMVPNTRIIRTGVVGVA